MDILYIVSEHTDNNHFDLRCSLRSISTSKGIDKIYIAGYCPDWISDEIIKVPIDDTIKNPTSIYDKHINILNVLIYVIDNTDINDHFLFSSDDHFTNTPCDFNNYPYYAKNKPIGSKSENYNIFLKKTESFLIENGLSTIFCTIHRNMHVKKHIVKEFLKKYPNFIYSGLEPWLCFINYEYSKYGIDFEFCNDIKIISASQWYQTSNEYCDCFSTTDFEYKTPLYVLLGNKFKNKCKYEI